MKKLPLTLSLTLLFALVMLSFDSSALAKRAKKSSQQDETSPSPSQSYNGGSLSSTPWGKTFGLGLQLGDHSSITGKLRLERNTALVFGVGAGWSWGLGSGLELSVGYVMHPSLLGTYKPLRLSWYIGGALDLMILTNYNRSTLGVIPVYYGYTPFGLGAHMPIGLDFQLRVLPMSVYAEITPGLDLFPRVGPRLGFALGARFFF